MLCFSVFDRNSTRRPGSRFDPAASVAVAGSRSRPVSACSTQLVKSAFLRWTPDGTVSSPSPNHPATAARKRQGATRGPASRFRHRPTRQTSERPNGASEQAEAPRGRTSSGTSSGSGDFSSVPRLDDTEVRVGSSSARSARCRGSSLDYTTAPVGRAVIMLAVPMVLEMAMESIFAVADVFWVAHLGADAVATVGLTESMMTMIYTAAHGPVDRRHRAGRAPHRRARPRGRGARRGQSIVLGLAVAAAIALLGAPLAPQRCCGSWARSPTVVAHGSGFTRVMLGGNATVLLLFLHERRVPRRRRRRDRDARARGSATS